jgi:N-hydroxyarylamine O-acetyltransferase
MSDLLTPEFDLPAYLARIEYGGSTDTSADTLSAVHSAHATHVPFENLDVLLGRPIRLDLASLQAKLVTARRGGYCFEQNSLLAAALSCLGFAVTPLAGRVRFGRTEVRPRTHMLLKVEASGTSWLADVGFGGEGLFSPIRLELGEISQQHAWTYRIGQEVDVWVLQSLHGQEWMDLYSFTMEPQYPIDYEMASYFTSTHPDSIFRKIPTIQLPTAEARLIVRDHEFMTVRGQEQTTRAIEDDAELGEILAATFGLRFPPGTRFYPEPGREPRR